MHRQLFEDVVPGLAAWLHGAAEIPGVSAFRAAKWLENRGSNTLEQAALAHFMASGEFERHLRHAAQSLRARRTAMLASLRKHARDGVEVIDSNAGMHLAAWLTSGNHADCERLARHARIRGLGLYTIAP